MLTIRPLVRADYPFVSRIYDEGLQTKIATFETEVPDWDEWNKKYIPNGRLLAEIDNEILAFAVLSLVSEREVYKGVGEVSVYVKNTSRGQGIGKQLLKRLVALSEDLGFWTLQAAIFPNNKPSLEMHRSCGFKVVGRRERIGIRDGKWQDNILMEKRSNKIGN
ncbi:MAG: N-acetyltransferase [Flavobacteriaceae bacterium]|nr:GNAT family N-acetyltransferase [Bacteroidia bacterium]NNF74390.1 N-acetyltransferase [Flavobacteriaceae bacterium]